MKPLLILFLTFIFIDSFGQQLQWEKVHQEGFSHEIWNAFPLSDGRILVQLKTTPSKLDIRQDELVLIDWNGNFLSTFGKGEHWNEVPGPVGNGPQLVGVGSQRFACAMDWVGVFGQWDFQRMDSDSLHEIQSIWGLQTIDGRDTLPKGAFITSSGTIVSAGGHMFQRVWDSNMYEGFYMDTLVHPVIGLFPFQPDLGLAFSTNALYTLDTNAAMNLIRSFPFVVDSVAAVANESSFLLLSDDTVRVCDQSGVIMDKLAITGLMDTIYQVGRKDSSFWVMGEINGAIMLHELSNGQVISTFQPDTAKATFHRFLLDPFSSRLMLLGYESATPQPHLLIQMYDSIPSAFQKTDLNLALISSELLLAEQQNCFSPYPAINHFRIKLEVENTSASAINSFFINGSWQPAAWLNIYACYLYCFAPQLAIKQNVHLNPGETASVEVDVSNGMLDPLPVCFWVSSPNGQSDRNPSDDRICMSVSVGLDELKPQLSDFTVIPNPASGVISVSFQNQPSGMSRNLELYDVSGRMVDRYAIQSSTTVIPIHQLAAGVYILKAIDTSASVSVKRVIIK